MRIVEEDVRFGPSQRLCGTLFSTVSTLSQVYEQRQHIHHHIALDCKNGESHILRKSNTSENHQGIVVVVIGSAMGVKRQFYRSYARHLIRKSAWMTPATHKPLSGASCIAPSIRTFHVHT